METKIELNPQENLKKKTSEIFNSAANVLNKIIEFAESTSNDNKSEISKLATAFSGLQQSVKQQVLEEINKDIAQSKQALEKATKEAQEHAAKMQKMFDEKISEMNRSLDEQQKAHRDKLRKGLLDAANNI